MASLLFVRGAVAQSVDAYEPVPIGSRLRSRASRRQDRHRRAISAARHDDDEQCRAIQYRWLRRCDLRRCRRERRNPGGRRAARRQAADRRRLHDDRWTAASLDGTAECRRHARREFADPAFNGTIWAIAVQPDGRILAGGTFTLIGSHAQNYFARLDANGAFDASFARPAALLRSARQYDRAAGQWRCADRRRFFPSRRHERSLLLRAILVERRVRSVIPGGSDRCNPVRSMVAPDGSIYLSNNGTGMMMKLDANGTPMAASAAP